MEVEVNVAPGPSVTPTTNPNICVRAGCTNPAVESKDWDKEYCSNECVATHCRCVQTDLNSTPGVCVSTLNVSTACSASLPEVCEVL